MKKSNMIIRISKLVAIHFVIASLIIGCKDEGPIKEIEYNSTFSVDKNEVPWNISEIRVSENPLIEGFNIGATNETQKGEEILTLAIKKTDIVIGEKLDLFTSEWALVVDGDIVIDNSARYDSASINYLLITELDTINHIIQGEFETILLRDSHWTSNKEFMKFVQGKFDAKYK